MPVLLPIPPLLLPLVAVAAPLHVDIEDSCAFSLRRSETTLSIDGDRIPLGDPDGPNDPDRPDDHEILSTPADLDLAPGTHTLRLRLSYDVRQSGCMGGWWWREDAITIETTREIRVRRRGGAWCVRTDRLSGLDPLRDVLSKRAPVRIVRGRCDG